MFKCIYKEIGFTLVELLLVIALIGILTGLVISVVNIPGMRAKARDSQRIADLKKLQIALGLYYADIRQYPVTGSLASLAGYIDRLPMDPSTGNNYCYVSDGSIYVVAAGMEVTSTAEESPCTSLNAWSVLGAPCSGVVNCYGVESP